MLHTKNDLPNPIEGESVCGVQSAGDDRPRLRHFSQEKVFPEQAVARLRTWLAEGKER